MIAAAIAAIVSVIGFVKNAPIAGKTVPVIIVPKLENAVTSLVPIDEANDPIPGKTFLLI